MDITTDKKDDADHGTKRRAEQDAETQSPSDPSFDEASSKSDAAEAPAAEGLLLLQHVAETVSDVSRSLQCDAHDDVNPVDPDLDSAHVNPIHELLKTGVAMRVTEEVEQLNRFRGVFALPRLSVYYSLIEMADRFHFLGFHATPLAAAQAWDLAAMKRAMDSAQNLSTARTNFRLEDYVRMESVLSMMVVLRFEELVEMFREAHQSLIAVTSEDDLVVEKMMEACKQSFPDELGTVLVPAEVKEGVMASPEQTLTADQMRDLIAATCTQSSNNWVKNIRDSKKWKGVYFSKDGVAYSKVEFDGESQYLGRFDTIEAAARAYDLATLKRAMAHHQSTVALNFPKEEYIRDKQLMEFLYLADHDQVSHFIRMLAQNQRTSSVGDHYLRGRTAHKRQKLDGPGCMTAFSNWSRKPVESSVQYIDWNGLGLEKTSSGQSSHRGLPNGDRGDVTEEGEGVEAGKKPEMQVERRICDANMAALVKESTDWVRVALNAVALRMTHNSINIHTEHVSLPGVVTEWFGALATEVEGRHAVELTNACGKRSFHFICYISKDQCRFSSTAWNQFVDETGLSVGDILVLLKSNACWKLAYAVFVLPDALMVDSIAQSLHHGGHRFPKIPGMYIPPTAAVRPSAAPSAPTPAKRTLQAHVLPNAQNLTNIQVLQKTQDGRLLVEAGLLRDFRTNLPVDVSKRGYFVIPANSVRPAPTAPVMRPPSGFVNNPGPQLFPGGNKRFLYGSQQTPHHGTSRMQRPLRPACLPAAPIRVNIRGGIKALSKKSDSNLFMVTDSNGQMRLVTTQPPQHPSGQNPGHPLQSAGFSNSVQESETAVGYPSHFFAQEGPRRPQVADLISQTPPEITVIDPSTTGSDASGTGTEKPNQQEEHSSQKQVIDLVEDEDKEHETTEKQGDSLPDMYSHITKILEKCEGLDVDTMKKYKFSFVNKMTQGQQTANYMELKSLSQAGEWLEVTEWIKSTVENLA